MKLIIFFYKSIQYWFLIFILSGTKKKMYLLQNLKLNKKIQYPKALSLNPGLLFACQLMMSSYRVAVDVSKWISKQVLVL